jgi:hypothetical protein
MRRCFGLLTAFLLAACTLAPGTPPGGPSAVPSATARPAPTAVTAAATSLASAATPAPTTPPPPPTVAPPTPTGTLDETARVAAAEPLARDQVALAEALKGVGDVPDVARTAPLDVKVGDVETFWISNVTDGTNYQISARLRYAGPVALMYVDTSVDVVQADIEKSAREFEDRIYPRDRALFGAELSPGIDGDPRLTILNAPVQGAGGYFSSADTVVKAVNRFSNEREMFVIAIDSYPLGSDGYALTLAHEFQHMIEWNLARRSPLWFNEGMSMLAQDLNGYITNGSAGTYLADPDVQLTTFSRGAGDPRLFSAHYGASQLFLRYFQEQYAGEAGMADLIKADAGDDPAAFVTIAARKRPDITEFASIYADWAVANVLNDPAVGDGRYAYQLLPERAALLDMQTNDTATVSQFGVDYYGELSGPATIDFNGADSVGVTGARPKDGGYTWWSNRGDDSMQTLTRAFDLRGVRQATLQFATWHEFELDYDYAFVGVSTDGGATWTALKGNTTTDSDPQGLNYGNGLTGISGAPGVNTDTGTRGQWIAEQMDLTPFAGKQIMLRFWAVADEGYNAPGMLLDDIRIPELGYGDGAEGGDGGWQAQGFVRTTGELPQTWALRLVRVQGGATNVEQPAVDGQGRATMTLGAGERGILAVIGTTPFTTEPASYSYAIVRP